MYVFLSITYFILNEMGRKKDPRYIRIRGITNGVITGERCITSEVLAASIIRAMSDGGSKDL
jgi:hypothetical protein